MDDPRTRAHPIPSAAPGGEGGDALGDYPAALIETTLERVLASNTFRRSRRHRQFLEHVIRTGLAGKRDRLKEVIIGVEVFGRSLADYDPRRDPIVRVEAGRVRNKLKRFYESEGAGEAFQIVVPVGNYMPRFVRRTFSAAATNAPTLAVLPFMNHSGDPRDASFALALADQLIDTIGRIPGQKIIARVSASKARDAGMDLKAIGSVLGGDHVIEGSLQRSGSRLRCIAQLSRTRDGVRVWSQRFEHAIGRDDALFDFQHAIADAVLSAVSSLQPPVSGGARASRAWSGLVPVGTANHAARDLFERARCLAQQRTPEGDSAAIALFEHAAALDPTFAQAHSQLGAAYAKRDSLGLAPTFPTYANVERAARRAVELDPLDGEARALLATIACRVEYRWAAAEPMFQEALRLAPNSTLVHSSFAWALVFNGRFEEAIGHARLAQELEPLDLGVRAENAAIAMYARKYDAAILELKSVLQLEPDHLLARVALGETYLSIGDPGEALAHLEHAVRLAPGCFGPEFRRLCAIGLRGGVAAAHRSLDELLARIGTRHYSRVDLAMTQACLGDLDGALTSLVAAGEARDVRLVCVPVHALFETLRVDPRCREILGRYGIGPVVPPSPARSMATAPGGMQHA